MATTPTTETPHLSDAQKKSILVEYVARIEKLTEKGFTHSEFENQAQYLLCEITHRIKSWYMIPKAEDNFDILLGKMCGMLKAEIDRYNIPTHQKLESAKVCPKMLPVPEPKLCKSHPSREEQIALLSGAVTAVDNLASAETLQYWEDEFKKRVQSWLKIPFISGDGSWLKRRNALKQFLEAKLAQIKKELIFFERAPILESILRTIPNLTEEQLSQNCLPDVNGKLHYWPGTLPKRTSSETLPMFRCRLKMFICDELQTLHRFATQPEPKLSTPEDLSRRQREILEELCVTAPPMSSSNRILLDFMADARRKVEDWIDLPHERAFEDVGAQYQLFVTCLRGLCGCKDAEKSKCSPLTDYEIFQKVTKVLSKMVADTCFDVALRESISMAFEELGAHLPLPEETEEFSSGTQVYYRQLRTFLQVFVCRQKKFLLGKLRVEIRPRVYAGFMGAKYDQDLLNLIMEKTCSMDRPVSNLNETPPEYLNRLVCWIKNETD